MIARRGSFLQEHWCYEKCINNVFYQDEFYKNIQTQKH